MIEFVLSLLSLAKLRALSKDKSNPFEPGIVFP